MQIRLYKIKKLYIILINLFQIYIQINTIFLKKSYQYLNNKLFMIDYIMFIKKKLNITK
jgi:hypothetical protein